MLSWILQLLHFSSNFWTAINSYLCVPPLSRSCSTRQHKCNLFLKFRSNFNVDKGISEVIMLRSLLPRCYCVQSYFLMQCVIILVSQSVFTHSFPTSPSCKIRLFLLMLPSLRISTTSCLWPSFLHIRIWLFSQLFIRPFQLPDSSAWLCYIYIKYTIMLHTIHSTLFFYLLKLLHSFKWAMSPRIATYSKLRCEDHFGLVF